MTKYDIKIYGHYIDGDIDHRVLFDWLQVEGENEQCAAETALLRHRAGPMAHYLATVVECDGVRRTPGAGRVYFFDGKSPLENFVDGSKGELCGAAILIGGAR